MARLFRSAPNVGNLLVWAGIGWLGFSFWLPYATAGRVFRIEDRTAAVTRQFSLAAARLQTIDWKDTATRDELLRQINEKYGSTDPESSRHLKAVPAPARLRDLCFMFEDKHYFYMVTHPPASRLGQKGRILGPGSQDPDPDRSETVEVVDVMGHDPVTEAAPLPLPEEQLLPFETYAWPRSKQFGVRTVFMSPSDGADVFTRNLSSRYLGMKKAPMPGNGRMDILSEKRENDYRGHDDERWIFQSAD